MTALQELSPAAVPSRRILRTAAIITTVLLALFFRTYPLMNGLFVSDKAMRQIAETAVRGQMRKQIEIRAMTGIPQGTPEVRARIVEQKLNALIEQDRASFENVVTKAMTGIAAQRKNFFAYRYLSEADPYYYLSLTQNVLATGHLGTRVAGGRFLNPLRHAPFGNPDVINFHPYVGAAVYHLLHVFKPGISVMRAVGVTPLFLTVIAVLVYFCLQPLLGLPLFPFWMGAQVFFLAPIVIQRSTLGWYDTDPYNLIFPALIFSTLLAVFKRPHQAVPLALIGGFLTGLYPLFWQGWTFILGLVALASGVIGITAAVRNGRAEIPRFAVLSYAGIYIVSALLFAVLFITPAGFFDTIVSDWVYSSRVRGGASELWPNLLVMVGETHQESFKKWIYLTSHYGVAIFAMLGILMPWVRRRKNLSWAAVMLIAVPLLAFSFTAERFAILAVLPLALLTAYGIEGTLALARDAEQLLSWAPAFGRRALRVFAVVIVMFAILPRSIAGAHVSGFQSHFIMNDAWYDVFQDLKNTAPKDSIVHSWWPPGYFINAVSGLRSVSDGGSHHFHENFWMAKAFMSRNERESGGLFRMLTAGGNRAMDFLSDHGFHGDAAVAFILNVVRQNRQNAAVLLPPEWSAKEKEDFLDATHGRGTLPAAYVLIYEDMMAQNLALQIVDAWSFEKAGNVFSETGKKKTLWESLLSGGAAEYTRKMLQVTGSGLPYEEPSPEAGRQGGRVIFKNGIVFEEATGRSFFRTGGSLVEILAFSKKGDSWRAVEPERRRMPLAVLVLPSGSSFFAVAVHQDLVPTTLFQLTYLEGRERPAFQAVSRHGSVQNGDYVYAYRIDWNKLES